jgi:hypothetical protein
MKNQKRDRGNQLALVFQPRSMVHEEARLHRFFAWLARAMPHVTSVHEIRRCHIEAFKELLRWVGNAITKGLPE